MKIKKVNAFKIKNILYVFLLILSSFNSSIAQDSLNTFQWQAGENLEYRVDWSFVYLGSISLKHLGKETINDTNVNHVRVTIHSNPLLFWLDNESVYDSYMTDSMKVVRFISEEKVDGEEYNATYDFDYNTRKINLTLLDKENPDSTKYKILDLKPNLIDGISLIYYSRIHSMYPKKDTVTTFIEDKSGDVAFDFSLQKANTEIGALDDSLKTVYFSGQLFIKGIAGVTGPFEAWFSDDNFRVPILSYMDVFVGRVAIELESWEHWIPQKSVTVNE